LPPAPKDGRLTAIAQYHWAPYLATGGNALDATAGNGHDTAWLAQRVGPSGRVYAIDLQPAALDSARRHLTRLGLGGRVHWRIGDHAELDRLLPASLKGQVNLACFNLGYLPGSSHEFTTRAPTTLAALAAVLDWMAPNGALSVIAYRGHPGGMEEAEAVEGFFRELPVPWRLRQRQATGRLTDPGPVWFLADTRANGAVPDPA